MTTDLISSTQVVLCATSGREGGRDGGWEGWRVERMEGGRKAGRRGGREGGRPDGVVQTTQADVLPGIGVRGAIFYTTHTGHLVTNVHYASTAQTSTVCGTH